MTEKIKSTKNIRLATCWMALGAEYVGVDRTDRSHQIFKFSSGEDKIREVEGKQILVTREVDLEDIEVKLANKQLMINANDLFDAFQRMKSIIHSF